MYYLLQHRQHTKGQYVLIIYTCAMFTVSTIYFCCAAKWSEIEFVESTVNPGVFASLLSSPIAIAKDTASVVNFWLADSLIVCSTNHGSNAESDLGCACRFTGHMWYGAKIYGSSSYRVSCSLAPSVCAP
jgi:hypothetical protein